MNIGEELVDFIAESVGDVVLGGLSDILSGIINVEDIMDGITGWIFQKIGQAAGSLFTMMNGMGSSLFHLSWVQAMLVIFQYFGWALFVVGAVVAVAETGIEAQRGKADPTSTAMNVIKGMAGAMLFASAPIALFQFCVTLQGTTLDALSLLFPASSAVDFELVCSYAFRSMMAGIPSVAIVGIIFMVVFLYCVMKIFFENIKRGGILLIQIFVGALYMYSVPRGYTDGFFSWVKQVIGTCLTAFIQTLLLFGGMMTFTTNPLLGLGVLLAAADAPRIAGNFGMDTTVKANLMSAVYTASSAMNMARMIR